MTVTIALLLVAIAVLVVLALRFPKPLVCRRCGTVRYDGGHRPRYRTNWSDDYLTCRVTGHQWRGGRG